MEDTTITMTSGKDEFIVACDKFSEIYDIKSKIERIFGVELGWGTVAKVENGSKQWITLSGERGDRRNAKEYIVALCHPDVTQRMQFPTSITENDILEPIEQQSNAVIKDYLNSSGLKTHELEIAGTDIAVTIALSLLESLLQSQSCEDDDTSSQSTSQDKSLAYQRLQDGLQRALSQHSDGGCSAEDYSLAPDSVKRVILQCLKNDSLELSDENDLFGAEIEDRTPLYQSESKMSQMCDHDQTLPSVLETDAAYPVIPLSSSKNVEGITQRLTDANFSTCSQSASRVNNSNSNFCVEYGRSVGYLEGEIMEALNFVDEKTTPSDFLELLITVKSQFGKNPLEMKNKTEESTVEPTTLQQKSASSSQLSDSLPQEYRLKLIQDMAEEGEYSSIEDLKRRNQERQQSLRRVFQDSEKAREVSVKYFDTDVTDKNDESVNGDKYDSASHQFNAKHKYSDSKPQKRPKKGKMSSKPPWSAHPDEWQCPQDEEETCVMKLWTPYDAACKDPHIDTTQTQVTCLKQQKQIYPRKPCTAPIATRAEPVDERVPRYVVIDGSNVAMTHGNGKIFSCKALKICVDYFLQRGHKKITVFVPVWRTYRPKPDYPISDQYILDELKEQGYLVFTPGRRLGNMKTISCYDDRFILDLAEKEDGVIVSLDQFRDLIQEKKCWQALVDERLLMYCFVGDNFMPPNDPLGRDGPNLTDFLLQFPDKSFPCPNRFLYENHHLHNIKANTPPRLQELDVADSPHSSQSKNWQQNKKYRRQNIVKKPTLRTQKSTEDLYCNLQNIFSEPNQKDILRTVLDNHPEERDINRLTNYCISVLFT